MEPAIVLRGLGKVYRRFHPGTATTLQEAFTSRNGRREPVEQFWALRDVSCSIPAGRTVGIIGPNGAGKSTLLQLVGHVTRPDEGIVKTQGRIGGLLDLQAGFHPDLTGRENAILGGVLAGLTRNQVNERLDSIVDFAELEGVIDNPLRTYSSGMRLRLGFAVATHTDPAILLIDEVLAVGDLQFQNKCLNRIDRFRKDGCTILLVSHDTNLVRQLCDEAIWLRAGRVVAAGSTASVLDRYSQEMTSETRRRTPREWEPRLARSGIELRVNENRFGSMELELTDIRILHPDGTFAEECESGAPLLIEIDYSTGTEIPAPIFGATITREEDGQVCYDANTASAGLAMPLLNGRGQINLRIDRLDLSGGRYYVDLGAYAQDWSYTYDYHWHVYPLTIRPNVSVGGVLHPPQTWELKKIRGGG